MVIGKVTDTLVFLIKIACQQEADYNEGLIKIGRSRLFRDSAEDREKLVEDFLNELNQMGKLESAISDIINEGMDDSKEPQLENLENISEDVNDEITQMGNQALEISVLETKKELTLKEATNVASFYYAKNYKWINL